MKERESVCVGVCLLVLHTYFMFQSLMNIARCTATLSSGLEAKLGTSVIINMAGDSSIRVPLSAAT